MTRQGDVRSMPGFVLAEFHIVRLCLHGFYHEMALFFMFGRIGTLGMRLLAVFKYGRSAQSHWCITAILQLSSNISQLARDIVIAPKERDTLLKVIIQTSELCKSLEIFAKLDDIETWAPTFASLEELMVLWKVFKHFWSH